MPSARTPLRAAGRGHPWVRRLARRSPRDARRRRSRAPPRRAFSGPSRPPAGLLLRDLLHRAHRPRLWILRAARRPRRSHHDPIDFSALLGQDYARALDARFANSPPGGSPPSRSSSPTTPARWLPILRAHRDSTRTNPFACTSSAAARARAPRTLAHVRDAAPDVYARMSYVSVEVSRVLADAQRRAVRDVFKAIRNVSCAQTSTQSETPPDHRTECRCATRRIARDGARWTARRSSSRWRCSITFRTIASARGRTARGRKPASPPTPARLSKSSNPSPIR